MNATVALKFTKGLPTVALWRNTKQTSCQLSHLLSSVEEADVANVPNAKTLNDAASTDYLIKTIRFVLAWDSQQRNRWTLLQSAQLAEWASRVSTNTQWRFSSLSLCPIRVTSRQPCITTPHYKRRESVTGRHHPVQTVLPYRWVLLFLWPWFN